MGILFLGRNYNKSLWLYCVYFSFYTLICTKWTLITLSSMSITISLLLTPIIKVKYHKIRCWIWCKSLKTAPISQRYPCLSQPHMLAGPFPLHYTGFLFFPMPSLSIFSSPAGQGSPAATRAHSSLPTFFSTCSYLAEPSGILKAWRRAICCLALHHFTPDPSSLCMHPDFFFPVLNHTALLKDGVCAEMDKSQNHHLAEGEGCAG